VVRVKRWGKSPPVLWVTMVAVRPVGCKTMYIPVPLWGTGLLVLVATAGKGRSLKARGDSCRRLMTGTGLVSVQDPAYRLAVSIYFLVGDAQLFACAPISLLKRILA